MRVLCDQIGREVEVPSQPRRIVSLVPSQTELLFDLGLESEVVGITRFCIYPENWYRSKTRVGGTKDATVERILALKPDLVIGNKEENAQSLIQELESEVAVWMTDVRSVHQAMKMILDLGLITGHEQQARGILEKWDREILEIPTFQPLRSAYLIWNKPLMVAGSDTFIHEMLALGGFENCFSENRDSRYPQTSWSELRRMNPDVLLLSSEPFPFTESHIAAVRKELPFVKVVCVNGELFSWYGSRILRFPAYIRSLRTSLDDISRIHMG